MKLQRSYHKEVQQIAAHCGIEGSVPLSPQINVKLSLGVFLFCGCEPGSHVLLVALLCKSGRWPSANPSLSASKKEIVNILISWYISSAKNQLYSRIYMPVHYNN